MFPKIMKLLSKRMNFKLEFVPSVDGKWGKKSANGSWNGIVGMLIRKEVDICSGGMSVMLQRSQVMDFSMSLLKRYTTLVANPNTGKAVNLWVFTEVFPKEAWMVLFIFILAVSVAFVVSEKQKVFMVE